MDENRFKVIAADGYQEPTDPKKAKLEIDSVSLQPTAQKVKSFVKFCIENQSSQVNDECGHELVAYTTSG